MERWLCLRQSLVSVRGKSNDANKIKEQYKNFTRETYFPANIEFDVIKIEISMNRQKLYEQ